MRPQGRPDRQTRRAWSGATPATALRSRDPSAPVDLSRLIVGSEGTLGVVVEARVNLVPLPDAKAVMALEFDHLLDALGATPVILEHGPSAIEVMDRFILDHARESPALDIIQLLQEKGEVR